MTRKEWECKVLDVKTAFLQGNELKRDIYLKPPKEAKTKGMWKLNKAVYGLNEASQYRYERVKDVLINAGMLKSKYDEALFYWKMKVFSLVSVFSFSFILKFHNIQDYK